MLGPSGRAPIGKGRLGTGGWIMAIKWQDYIEERKGVMMGKPVFKGTRLTVEHVLRELGTGMNGTRITQPF